MPWLFFLLIVLVDQGTKALVQHTMHLRESIPLVGTILRITYIRNPKGAFGLPLGGNTVFVIVSVLAVFLILSYLLRMPKEKRWSRMALSPVLGGAVGNLIDRLRFGEVIDYIDIGVGNTRWPVFNVADIGVTVGVALLFFALFLKKES